LWKEIVRNLKFASEMGEIPEFRLFWQDLLLFLCCDSDAQLFCSAGNQPDLARSPPKWHTRKPEETDWSFSICFCSVSLAVIWKSRRPGATGASRKWKPVEKEKKTPTECRPCSKQNVPPHFPNVLGLKTPTYCIIWQSKNHPYPFA